MDASAKTPLPYETSIADVLVKIRETFSNPNLGKMVQVVLKNGPRTFRVATLWEIVEGTERKFHHYSLRIDTIDRTKKRGWFSRPDASARLEGEEDDDEIQKLYRFLKTAVEKRFPSIDGDVHILDSSQYTELQRFLVELPKLPANDKLEIVKHLLSKLEGTAVDVDQFLDVFSKSDATTIQHIGTAARMVEYQRALSTMRDIVESNCASEQKIQVHLRSNPWLFGSEYSRLVDRRRWTRDDEPDFMLRRSVDGYLEIVEIKTPFPEALFVHDQSHDSYYPSSKLSPAIGQVVRYIEEVDRHRDSIIAEDGCDPLKIRARIIIGRDGDEHQIRALRNLNAHLHGIEVLTFDQLLRIGEQVLSVFRIGATGSVVAAVGAEDDLPF
jgi:hypothetical protein